MRAPSGLLLALALALAACGSNDQTPPHGAHESPSSAQAPAPVITKRALPAAIRLAKDLVMAPVGYDRRGCVIYQMESQSRPALQSAFYRTRAGDFSTIEEEAACT